MKRRRSTHGKHTNRRGRRADRYRAWHREEPAAMVCPHCRRATWPTRSAAKESMKATTDRPDWTCPDGFTTVVYPCPAEHGWHWRVTTEQWRDEQAPDQQKLMGLWQ